MVEYCDCNIWYKKKKKSAFKKFAIFLAIFLLVLGGFLYYKNVIITGVFRICEDYTSVCMTKTLNNAVIATLTDKINYYDLVNVEKDSSGNVAFMTTNSFKVNVISRNITDTAQKSLEIELLEGVPIPFLAFTGIGVLSGYGNEIAFKSIYLSQVDCEFSSCFKSVGINQTLHSIYIDFNAKIFMEVPLGETEVLHKTSVLLCESVVIGKVPDVILNGNLFG